MQHADAAHLWCAAFSECINGYLRGGSGGRPSGAGGGAWAGTNRPGSIAAAFPDERVDSLRLRKVEHIVCWGSHDANLSYHLG